MFALMTAVQNVLQLAIYVILVQAIMSWLVQFEVVNLRQPLVARIWYALNRAVEPLYRPVRRLLPAMQGIDFTPLAVIVGIWILQKIVLQLFGAWPTI